MMEGQQLLTLRERGYSRWGRDRFPFCTAYNGSQYSVYDYLKPVTPHNTDTKSKTIINTPFMHIFTMGLRWYRKLNFL
jgi:hypothetical protein